MPEPDRYVISPEADAFIDLVRSELPRVEASLPDDKYAILIAYFSGFFSEEDRRVNCGYYRDDDDHETDEED